ncbi:MAG: hypothetical protein A2Y38_08495 [Spirochaetes bacterium GWB1_59_5]|nr:MAG: hypothetical protein A2Y38_08495 [Spirochaetes bacterium GWB1_59_5]
MKMAKADEKEWKKCMDFSNELENQVKDPNDEKLGRWVKENYVWLGRTLYGYRVLVDNCCDPAKDTLEWKPEIAAAIAAYKPEASAESANAPANRPEATI